MAKNKLAPKGLAKQQSLVSIVVPCFRESKNLPILYDRVLTALKAVDFDWELILIDDHSPDDTYAVASSLAAKDKRLRVFRLARNSGSHVAIACGLGFARGQAAVVLAADLQDPPEIIQELVNRWRTGDQIVWAIGNDSDSKTLFSRTASRVYWWLLMSMLPRDSLSIEGADFFLLDSSAISAIGECRELNINIVGTLLWLGLRHGSISYERSPRLHGKTGWTFRKKIRAVVNSFTSFSHFPLRLMSLIGFVIALFGFIYAIYVVIRYFYFGINTVGWSSLITAVTVFSGIQMIMLGVIGEYLWRTLDETRRRPRHIIEASTEQEI